MQMARFYVFKGKRLLWNLFVLMMVVVALVYVFYAEEQTPPIDLPEAEGDMQEPAMAVVQVQDDPIEFVELAEHVTVKPVPTKFSEYRLERERVRSRQMELLQAIAYDPNVGVEGRAEAQKELQDLIAVMTRETEIENLLKAKGYLDGVVILDENSITVVVPATLTREEAARIGEIVNRLTDVRLDRITIIDEPLSI